MRFKGNSREDRHRRGIGSPTPLFFCARKGRLFFKALQRSMNGLAGHEPHQEAGIISEAFENLWRSSQGSGQSTWPTIGTQAAKLRLFTASRPNAERTLSRRKENKAIMLRHTHFSEQAVKRYIRRVGEECANEKKTAKTFNRCNRLCWFRESETARKHFKTSCGWRGEERGEKIVIDR